MSGRPGERPCFDDTTEKPDQEAVTACPAATGIPTNTPNEDVSYGWLFMHQTDKNREVPDSSGLHPYLSGVDSCFYAIERLVAIQ
jgi:hypothetical protein